MISGSRGGLAPRGRPAAGDADPDYWAALGALGRLDGIRIAPDVGSEKESHGDLARELGDPKPMRPARLSRPQAKYRPAGELARPEPRIH
jgi:hypothetical protein